MNFNLNPVSNIPQTLIYFYRDRMASRDFPDSMVSQATQVKQDLGDCPARTDVTEQSGTQARWGFQEGMEALGKR